MSLSTALLINELQTYGVRLVDPKAGLESRRGGAGPSDHKAMTHRRRHADGAGPYRAGVREPLYDREARRARAARGFSATARRWRRCASLRVRASTTYPPRKACPIPISRRYMDVTCSRPPCLQSCIRYQSRTKSCQFCAIGQSLAAGRTIAHKTPAQLAEVAKAAVGAGRRQAHGDDHGHAKRRRPRRGGPCRERDGGEECGRSADPGAMRAARRRRVVLAPENGGRRYARHAS